MADEWAGGQALTNTQSINTPPTNAQLGIRRAAEMAAVFMIGDGLLGVFQPQRHVDLWRSDVTAVDVLIRPFKDRPGRRRAYGVIQATAGFWLASRLQGTTVTKR